jgi:hypothetical protein
MVGKPVIRGTRIPVALILKMLGQGIPIEEILREYPRLEKMDIYAAYLLNGLGNVDAETCFGLAEAGWLAKTPTSWRIHTTGDGWGLFASKY